MPNARARDEKKLSTALPQLVAQLEVLSAPNLKLVIVPAEFDEPPPRNREQTSSHCFKENQRNSNRNLITWTSERLRDSRTTSFLALVQWNSFPVEIPVPRASGQIVFVSSLLRLENVGVSVNGIDHRNC